MIYRNGQQHAQQPETLKILNKAVQIIPILKMEDKIYPLQKSQDKDLKKKFYNLHVEIVNKVIGFCKENNIQIDEFNIYADGVRDSISFGEWTSVTDSCFRMDESLSNENDKDVYKMSDEEYRKAKINHKPFLLSM